MEDDSDESDTRGNEAGSKDEAMYVPMVMNRYKASIMPGILNRH